MTSRILLEAKAGLDGALWRFILAEVEKQASNARIEASRYRIESMPDLLVREQMFMKANAIEDFIGSLPSLINEAYKEQLQLEQKTPNE